MKLLRRGEGGGGRIRLHLFHATAATLCKEKHQSDGPPGELRGWRGKTTSGPTPGAQPGRAVEEPLRFPLLLWSRIIQSRLSWPASGKSWSGARLQGQTGEVI